MPASDSANNVVAGFIVGMSRAGTTWLCKCLNEHSQIAAFGESLFFGRRWIEPGSNGRSTPEQVRAIQQRCRSDAIINSVRGDGPGCLKRVTSANLAVIVDEAFAALPSHPTPVEVFTALAGAIARAEGKSIAVEKTPHHINWIDRILAHYPNAKIIVCVREPYGFMLSYKHQGDRRHEAMRRKLARLYHPLACAIVWRGYMRAAMAAKQLHPSQVMLVEFDELRNDSRSVLEEVQRFLGREIEDLAARVPPDNTSFPDAAGAPRLRPGLFGDDVFWMNLIAGRAIRRGGYQRRRTPVDPLRIAWSVIRIPIWAVWYTINLRQIVSGSLPGYLWRWLLPAREPRIHTDEHR